MFLQEENELAKRKYGSKEVNAIEKITDKNPHLTSRELKMRMPRLLKNLSARIVRRSLDIDLDCPARVAPEKIYLTDEMKARRVEWATTNLRRKKSSWESVLFVDEVMFEATGGGGSWRLVRRPRGTPRHDQVLQNQVQEAPQGDGFGRNLGIWSKVPHIPPPWCEHEL